MNFEEFENIAMDAFDSLPNEIKANLNMGMTVLRGHKDGEDGLTLVLGEYYVDHALGRGIKIFYGSFMDVMGGAPEAILREEIISTVKHELRHHMEISAGVDYLGDEDREKMAEIRNRSGRAPSEEEIRQRIVSRLVGSIVFLVVLLILIYILVLRFV